MYGNDCWSSSHPTPVMDPSIAHHHREDQQSPAIDGVFPPKKCDENVVVGTAILNMAAITARCHSGAVDRKTIKTARLVWSTARDTRVPMAIYVRLEKQGT